MADYLLHARPTTTSGHLFVSMVAPFTGLATSSITGLVGRACARAGVSRFGPHGMRHAVACELLAGGTSMAEIGQLLRHAQERTTAIYAKGRSDPAGLARDALPAGSRPMSMRTRAEEYLALRRCLGRTMHGDARMLRDFADRLDSAGQPRITVAAAVEWAMEPTTATPQYWRHRLSVVRGFARHLNTLDPASEIPPADLIVAPSHRKPPYVYSSAEIAALVHAAGTITAPLPAAGIQALISLIAARRASPGRDTRP
jgi:hypothetical protein